MWSLTKMHPDYPGANHLQREPGSRVQSLLGTRCFSLTSNPTAIAPISYSYAPIRTSLIQPARHLAAGGVRFEFRLFDLAVVHDERAARMEAASAGRVERAGHVPLQDDALTFEIRVGHRHCGHQRLVSRRVGAA